MAASKYNETKDEDNLEEPKKKELPINKDDKTLYDLFKKQTEYEMKINNDESKKKGLYDFIQDFFQF